MTQYQIGHKFPNHDQGRKEALKALLDGVCLKNSYGQITAFINNHFRYWNTLDPGWCLLWDSSLIDRGPTSTLDQDIRWAFEGADEFLKQYKERVEGQTNDPA